MGLTGTESSRLSKKSIKARKSIPTFLGLIGRTYDFAHDNIGQTEPRLLQSRNQRRRQNQQSRKISNRYAFCEFGTRSPISSTKPSHIKSNIHNNNFNIHNIKYSSHNINSSTRNIGAVLS